MCVSGWESGWIAAKGSVCASANAPAVVRGSVLEVFASVCEAAFLQVYLVRVSAVRSR